MGILASTALRQWPIEREYMPLLRSLADGAARVATNIALLTELFALPPPRLLDEMLCRQGVELHRFRVRAIGATSPSAWSDPATKLTGRGLCGRQGEAGLWLAGPPPGRHTERGCQGRERTPLPCS
jgi:hypothetical protein